MLSKNEPSLITSEMTPCNAQLWAPQLLTQRCWEESWGFPSLSSAVLCLEEPEPLGAAGMAGGGGAGVTLHLHLGAVFWSFFCSSFGLKRMEKACGVCQKGEMCWERLSTTSWRNADGPRGG